MQLKTTITIRVEAKDIQAAASWDTAVKGFRDFAQGSLPMGVTMGSLEITTAQARSKAQDGGTVLAA